ncbi:hypothetical protein AGMMS50229_10450 [Campylobacterota bacterium]|nr:hypothetical protein AGMMS50229_10450 [Campylobacterota bacterium]
MIVKESVKQLVALVPIIALLIALLVFISVALGNTNELTTRFEALLQKEVALSDEASKNAVFFGFLADENADALEAKLTEIALILDNEIKPLLPNAPFSASVAGLLQKAGQEIAETNAKIRTIRNQKIVIASESARILQFAPQLKHATEEVAQMMEHRHLPQSMISEARAQIDLVDRFVLMSATFLSSGSKESYENLNSAIKIYSTSLSNFANSDQIAHGSILALVATNQLFWSGFQDSLHRAIESRKSSVDESRELYAHSLDIRASFIGSLSALKADSSRTEDLLELAKLGVIVLIAAAIGYLTRLLVTIGKHGEKQFVK